MKKPAAKRPTKPTRRATTSPPANDAPGERLNRYLARCGLGSRREADRLIAAGRVTVNGETVADMGRRVCAGDEVRVDGRRVCPEAEHIYLLYHKPRGLMCARRDPRGRPLIYDRLDIPAHVQSVGRLDMDSEGLLLLTSDGALARALTRPNAALPRTYRVRVAGHPDERTLQMLRQGGVPIGRGDVSDPWDLIVDAETRHHAWLTITIRRGRWREVRRTIAAQGHPVRRLIRVGFGPLRLGDLPQGAMRPLTGQELRQLRQWRK